MFNYYMNPTAFPNENMLYFSALPQQNQRKANNSGQQDVWHKKFENLKRKYRDLEKENDALRLQIQELQFRLPQARKKKVKRRSDCQLEKDYPCFVQGCTRKYASKLALDLHMRQKHNAGSKKDRNQLISQVMECVQKGEPIPQIYLNLPRESLSKIQEAIHANILKSQISDEVKHETGDSNELSKSVVKEQ